MILVFGFPFYYFAACCLGFPLWLLLSRYNAASLSNVAIGGGAIGLILGFLFGPTTDPALITFTLAGMVPATIFWIIVNGRSLHGKE